MTTLQIFKHPKQRRGVYGLVVLSCLTLMTACTQFPELDARVPASASDAPYPKLLPLEQLLNAPEPQVSEQTIGNMQSRVASLKSRAARLQRPVISAPARSRLRRGVRAF